MELINLKKIYLNWVEIALESGKDAANHQV